MPSSAGNGDLKVMAWIKGAIALVIVGTVCFCVAVGREMPGHMLEIVLLVLAGYFGFSAKLYRDSSNARGPMTRSEWARCVAEARREE